MPTAPWDRSDKSIAGITEHDVAAWRARRVRSCCRISRGLCVTVGGREVIASHGHESLRQGRHPRDGRCLGVVKSCSTNSASDLSAIPP